MWGRVTRSPTFLVPVRALSAVFKAKFMQALHDAQAAGTLRFDPQARRRRAPALRPCLAVRSTPRHRWPGLQPGWTDTVDRTSRSVAKVARRARGQAAKANSGPGARLRIALQRRLRTYPATPRTADAAATAASDTLAKPTNASYRRRLSLIQTIPPVASPPR